LARSPGPVHLMVTHQASGTQRSRVEQKFVPKDTFRLTGTTMVLPGRLQSKDTLMPRAASSDPLQARSPGWEEPCPT
jgi:hypothetical protein